MNTLEVFHMRCQRQKLDVCCMVSSRLQCRGASAMICQLYWWHLTSSTLISVWPCCPPGPWSTSMMLRVWWWIPAKAERPAGEDRRVAPSQRLAQQSLGGCQRIYAVEIWDCQGSQSGATVTRTTRRWWWWWWRWRWRM